MIFKRLFADRKLDVEEGQAERHPRDYMVTRDNTADVRRRAMNLVGHPEVSASDQGKAKEVSMAAGMVEINIKYRDRRALEANLRLINARWVELTERYEHLLYPEFFSTTD